MNEDAPHPPTPVGGPVSSPAGGPIGGPVSGPEGDSAPVTQATPARVSIEASSKAGEREREPEPELTLKRVALLLLGQILPPLLLLSLITTPLDSATTLGSLGWRGAKLCLVVCVGSLIVRALTIGLGAPSKRGMRTLRLLRPAAAIVIALAVQTSVERSLQIAKREAALIATTIQAEALRDKGCPSSLAGWTVSQGMKSPISRSESGETVIYALHYQASAGRDRFVLTFRPRAPDKITFTGGPGEDLVVRIEIPGLGTTQRLDIADLLRR